MIVVAGVTAELSEFAWHFAKTQGFPKFKDEGNATATVDGLDIDVSFDIMANGTSIG